MALFKIGDRVRLKTDTSQTMVVIGYEKTVNGYKRTSVWCSWHDFEGKPQTILYPEKSLEPVQQGNQDMTVPIEKD